MLLIAFTMFYAEFAEKPWIKKCFHMVNFAINYWRWKCSRFIFCIFLSCVFILCRVYKIGNTVQPWTFQFPSFSLLAFQVGGCQSFSQHALNGGQRDTLSRSPVHHRDNIHKQFKFKVSHCVPLFVQEYKYVVQKNVESVPNVARQS